MASFYELDYIGCAIYVCGPQGQLNFRVVIGISHIIGIRLKITSNCFHYS